VRCPDVGHHHPVRFRIALLLALTAIAGCNASDSATRPPSTEAPAVIAQPPVGTVDQLLGPWSRTPYALDPGLAAAVDRTCRNDMDTFPAGIPLLGFDARGEGFVQVFYAGQNGEFAICNGIAITRSGPPTGMGGGSTGRSDQVGVALGPFELRQIDNSSEGRPVTRSFVSGRAGAGIKLVLIVLPGQQPVVASFANHWFGAWFPGPWPDGWTIVGFDAFGTRVAAIDGG